MKISYEQFLRELIDWCRLNGNEPAARIVKIWRRMWKPDGQMGNPAFLSFSADMALGYLRFLCRVEPDEFDDAVRKGHAFLLHIAEMGSKAGIGDEDFTLVLPPITEGSAFNLIEREMVPVEATH